MNKYARIGRPCLIRAIGPQTNHTTTELRDTNIVDRENTVCYECPYYQVFHMESYAELPEQTKNMIDSTCRNCPHCIYKKETVTKYVNETHRYGYGVRVGLIATKFLIYCHFLGPDKNGLVKYVNISEAAQTIGCSRRSVLNAVEKLSTHDYILAGKCGSGMLNILINSYKDNALPATKGGRGYITLNQDIFHQLMDCAGITQLRVMLRILLDSDTSNDGTATEDIAKFRRFLPSYCKPGIIKKALIKTGFRIIFSDTGKIRIALNKESCGKICYQADFKSALSAVKEYMYAVKKDMETANQKIIHKKNISSEKRKLKKLGYSLDANKNGLKFFVNFKLSDQDLHDLANVAVSFSIDDVKKALVQVYNNYNVSFKDYKIGPLVRSMIKYGDCSAVFD